MQCCRGCILSTVMRATVANSTVGSYFKMATPYSYPATVYTEGLVLVAMMNHVQCRILIAFSTLPLKKFNPVIFFTELFQSSMAVNVEVHSDRWQAAVPYICVM